MNERELVKQILSKIPRPNYDEIPDLYLEIDNMGERIGKILVSSELYEKGLVRFDKATPASLYVLMAQDPDVMIPFFVMVCGFSVRELERLAGIKDIYTLRNPKTFENKRRIAERFAEFIAENLKHPLYLETVLYKFYKNWEEHQKRHYRGKVEDKIRQFFEQHGYPCGKLKVNCEGKEIEIDGAIPPDPKKVRVALQIRTGVRRDLVKRAKEFSSEYEDILRCLPDVKFVPVYFVPLHEKDKLEDFRSTINKEREGKEPYAAVVLTWEEIEKLLELLPKWEVKQRKSLI